MACFHLIDAWQTESGKIVFAERGKIRRKLRLPCGQCDGCRLERSRQWAVRCLHEAQLHSENCFVTLTYDDAHIPYAHDLVYDHFQLFMKRLRRKMGPVRFYMCGEYGSECLRPHFHACLFGVNFSDRVIFKRLPSGSDIYRSKMLEQLWPYGYASVGDVTFESAAYVARYVMKKMTGPKADAHYQRIVETTGEIVSVEPEFCSMSLKPGIAAGWFEKYSADVYPRDGVIVNGRKVKPPKFYDRLLKRSDPFAGDDLEYERYVRSLDFTADNTMDRLHIREQVVKARLAFNKRSLE